MEKIILEKLKTIENTYNVDIVYACETGSRAWGFASPDSDYDVRFVFAFKDYLTINEPRDVIEFQVDEVWDITGWELKKSLRLFRSTNSAMIERLQSPIVYKETNEFRQKLNVLTPQYYAPKAGMHHYLNMTRNIFEKELQSDSVRLKKYFYALRTSLAALWIAKNQTAPPMTLSALSVNMPKHLESIVEEMLALKAVSSEKKEITQIADLQAFIQHSIEYCQSIIPQLEDVNRDITALDFLFKDFIFFE